MKVLKSLLITSCLSLTSFAHAWQWDSISPVAKQAVISASEFGSNWPGFLPEGKWSGKNPLEGCMIFGPYVDGYLTANGSLSASLSFNKIYLGTQRQHTCKKSNRLRGCYEWDNRSTPGSITVDVMANINGQGPRVVGISQRTLSVFPGRSPNGSIDLSLIGNHPLPAGPIEKIELRVCNHVGVDQSNIDIEFTKGIINIVQ
jgi:hypothetical protein